MTTIDLYSNYIGEIEIIFLEKNNLGNTIFKVELYYGNFTSLMGHIPIPTNMHSDSVFYNWFKCIGFYDDEIWECKRVQEFYDQLLAISNLTNESGLAETLDALKQICHSTLQNGNSLFIEYL